MNLQTGGRQLSFRFAQSPPVGMPISNGTVRSIPASRAQKRITSKAEGQDNGGPDSQLLIKLPPPRYTRILKKPMPEPILTQDTTFTYTKLMKILSTGNYPEHAVEFIKTAYHFVEKIYSKKLPRANGDPAIVHLLAPAIRAARMGLNAAVICACFLHDVIEDTNRKRADETSILPDQILNLFGPHALAQECGKDTLELVLLVTKPKLFEKEKRWIFPTSDEFFQRDDDYYREIKSRIDRKAEHSLYDDRSDVYYANVLNSGSILGNLLKLLDNVHNAETMAGLDPSKIMKNLRTMARNTMKHAAIFFVEEDVNHIMQLFLNMGIDIERSVEPIVPTTQVITFKLRDRFDAAAFLKHPNPKYAYISIYGSNPLVALAMDHVEVGLPPRIGLNYVPLLTNYLGNGFHVTREESAVPITSPVHESMVRITGFTDNDARSRVIQPSQVSPRYFDLLDENGRIIASVSLASLAKRDVRLGPHAEELLAKAEERYALLKELLRTFHQDEIYPALKNDPVNQ